MTPSKKQEKVPFLLTFTDLIYGLVVAVGLTYLPQLIDTKDTLSVTLLSFVFLLIFDDWYGEHFYGIEASSILGNLWFYADVVVFFVFFFYEYLGAKKSVFLLLAMVINGIRGLVMDLACLGKFSKRTREHALAYVSSGYAILFIIGYLSFFLIEFVWMQVHFLDEMLVSVVIGLWALLRISEHVFKIRAKRKTTSP